MLPLFSAHTPTDGDRCPPPTELEESNDQLLGDIQQASPTKYPLPRHHYRSPVNSPVKQAASPPSARRCHPEHFPLGPAGTGNRNLRELEMSGTCETADQTLSWGVVAMSPSSTTDVAPLRDGGEQAAVAASSTRKMFSPSSRSSSRRPPSSGEVRRDSGEDPLEAAPIPEGGRLDGFSRRSQGWKRRGRSIQAGGVDGEDEALSDGKKSGGTDGRRGAAGSLEVDDGCGYGAAASQSDAAAGFVDEEEIVVKAIKNSRLLSAANSSSSSSSCADGGSKNRSPRRRAAAAPAESERATPSCSTSSRVAANGHGCGATWTSAKGDATGSSTAGGGRSSGNRPLPHQRDVGEGESATAQSSAGQARGRAEVGRSHGARGRNTLGENGFCEGSDWLLKVNSPGNNEIP